MRIVDVVRGLAFLVPSLTFGYEGQGEGSLSPEVIRSFAPPALDPALKRAFSTALDVRTPGLGILTPDSNRLFFSWSVTGVSQVWRLDGPDRFPVQMTGGSESTSVAALTPDGRWVVLSRDRDGEEYPGLYLQPVNGGELVEIYRKPKVVVDYLFATDDSKSIYYSANDRTADAYAIYRYDLASKQRTLVLGDPGLWTIVDHRADGSMLVAKRTGALTSETFVAREAGGALRLEPLFGQNEKEEYMTLFGRERGEYFVLTPKFGEYRSLYRYAQGKFTALEPKLKWDVEDFAIDDDRRRLVYLVNEGGYRRLRALDTKTLKPIPLPPFPEAEHVDFGTFSRDGRYLTVGVSTPNRPRQNYVLDWKTSRLTAWTQSSLPETSRSAFVATTVESYPARDGTPIPVVVRRPKSCAEPCPILVHFHGGPEGQSAPGFRASWQPFLDAGFVIVEPNVRGSTGYGKAWLAADDGPAREQVITDIEDAARWARRWGARGGREPKVGVMGWSYGGYSALIAMTRFAGAFDAGASLVGIGNLVSFLENTAPYRRALRISEYGDPVRDREALIKLSPITYVDRVRSPLLIVQGANDPRVPAGEAVQMYEALKARGIPAELILFADEGHGSAKKDNKVTELGSVLRFFETHLKMGAP